MSRELPPQMLNEELSEVMSGSALRVQAAETMLRGCLVHAQRGHLTCRDRLALAEATSLLSHLLRLEEGLVSNIERIRNTTSHESALAALQEESETEEEYYSGLHNY